MPQANLLFCPVRRLNISIFCLFLRSFILFMKMFFFVALFWLQCAAQAQTNPDATRLQALFTDSRNVVIPEDLLSEIREASVKEGISEGYMIKNLIYVQAILNTAFSTSERIALCKLALLRFERGVGYFPVSVIRRLQAQLVSSDQSRKP
jgi:hypothetical protein